MRYTKKDNTWCFDGSGCRLEYVGTQPLNIDITEYNIDYIEGLINKLGQLEDIEDELGIDLITFLKGIDPDTCFMQTLEDIKNIAKAKGTPPKVRKVLKELYNL